MTDSNWKGTEEGMKIAVLIGGILYDSQKSLLEGIMDYAKEEGVNVFVFTCGGDVYTINDHNLGEFQIYNLPDLNAYDGVIVAPNTIQNESVVENLKKKLASLSVPVLSIDAKLGDFVSFEVDNQKSIYEMGREACRTLAGRSENMIDRVFNVKYHFSESCGCGRRKLEDIRGMSYQLAREKSNNVEWSKLINSMAADINERNTLTEFVDGLKPYVRQMDFPCFYLCLCGEECWCARLWRGRYISGQGGAHRLP